MKKTVSVNHGKSGRMKKVREIDEITRVLGGK